MEYALYGLGLIRSDCHNSIPLLKSRAVISMMQSRPLVPSSNSNSSDSSGNNMHEYSILLIIINESLLLIVNYYTLYFSPLIIHYYALYVLLSGLNRCIHYVYITIYTLYMFIHDYMYIL